MKQPTIEQVVQALIDYHEVSEVEADAMDYGDSAEWHKSVAQWLTKDGVRVVQEQFAIA